ncbi:MAG: HAD family hydrolase [Candidatus Andeanibacterium colombiense]|uniref:HAD family hydrolase n=1 Tax=Candidatus Andeanibacterium colombiense TaxID=3121345 RepID=A0AAJ5X0Y3_9SPHN|nr:MAG: HAD family hydrolase [Sphingomonadaceae bacterium]
MSRPLVISDCDEVLLHMLAHFRDYLSEEHAVDFAWEGGGFKDAMRRRGEENPLPEEEMWKLLNLFFDTEMHRQTPIPGAVAAMAELGRDADVVILTNLQDHRAELRAAQLADHGIHARVFTNQGPKGPALKRIIEEFGATRVAFIDDIAVHHASVAQDANHVVRLHLVGEPQVAPHVPCAFVAGDAHARIDNWAEALPWLLEKLHQEES